VRQRTGASTVELAVASPVLLIFLLGIIDAGQFANGYQTISNASREGARIAAKPGTDDVSDVQSAVIQYLSSAFPNVSTGALTAGVTVRVEDAAGDALSGSELSAVTTGAAIRVTVSMNFDVVRVIPGLDSYDNRVLATSTVMRRE
jgi:Flp pilus assembly protein TadG